MYIILLLTIVFSFIWLKGSNQFGTSFVEGESLKQKTIAVIDHFKVDGDRLSFVSNIKDESVQVTYQIKSEKEKEQLMRLQYGCLVVVSGEFIRPEANRNFNQFDYQQYLKKQGIHFILQVKAIKLTERMQRTPLRSIKNIRIKISKMIDQHFETKVAAYIQALLVGDKNNLDLKMYQNYQKMGVVHLLAISGLHVNLFFGMLYYVCLRIGITKEKISYIICLLLPFYALLSGFNAPVTRACMMLFIFMLATKLRLHLSGLSILFLTFIICFSISPNSLYTVGFQLSYFVCFTIMMSAKVILKRTQNWFKTTLLLSFFATFSSSIVMMYHFYEFSIAGIFLNLVYVPLFSFFILPLCICAVVFGFFPFINEFIRYFLKLCIHLSEGIAEAFQQFPLLTIITGRPPSILLFLFLCIFLITLFALEKKRYFMHSLFAYITIIIIFPIPLTGKVSFIDVGQGDSILIQLPFFGGNYLIDTGGTLPSPPKTWQEKHAPFSVAENILIPTLKSKGISHLNKIFITHSDADHMGALTKLANHIKVDEVVIPNGAEQKKIMENTLKELPNTKVTKILAPKNIAMGKHLFQVIAPNEKVNGENNGSLVIKAQLGGLGWLFTGDIEKETEKKLINQDIRADVLKVAHHGSKTSTSKSFLEAVHPSIAIISCGKNNRFGHPHQETINTLQNAAVKILRTDKWGEITYVFYEGFKNALK